METGAGKVIDDRGLAMDIADLQFCQEYFRGEHRNPTITEIKVMTLTGQITAGIRLLIRSSTISNSKIRI